MRRFRRRRRRIAAAALLPIAAILTTNAFAMDGAGTGKARIDTSTHTVAIGNPITLDGTFPGAAKVPVEIRYRAAGSSTWHTAARATTGASGRYRARVTPRRSAHWRAEIATSATGRDGAAAIAEGVDTGTGTERVAVRSKTRARIGGRHALVGDKVKIKGTVSPAGSTRRIVVRVDGERTVTRAGRNGRFSLGWKAKGTGVYNVEVRARSNREAAGSRDSAGRIAVYRPAAASWYGPGLYGNSLACGGTLSAGTMGVAHKTLPCGTKVRLRYGSNTVTVPVVDRGPFAGNREFDLTAATKQALGFPDVGTVLTTR
jgi:hypothetical protein